METIKFYIAFGGFYESMWDSIIDDFIFNEEIDYEKVDYKGLYKKASEEIFELIKSEIEEEFEVKIESLKYDGLESPRFYNFTTDKIKATISSGDREMLLKEFGYDEEVVEFIEENSKSRSGFTSFCSGIKNVRNHEQFFLDYLFMYFFEYFFSGMESDNYYDSVYEEFEEGLYSYLWEFVED